MTLSHSPAAVSSLKLAALLAKPAESFHLRSYQAMGAHVVADGRRLLGWWDGPVIVMASARVCIAGQHAQVLALDGSVVSAHSGVQIHASAGARIVADCCHVRSYGSSVVAKDLTVVEASGGEVDAFGHSTVIVLGPVVVRARGRNVVVIDRRLADPYSRRCDVTKGAARAA